MKEYIFVLGREPELSFLEVLSFFKSHNIPYKIVEHKDNILILLLNEMDFDDLIKKLGGVVKIAEVFNEYKYKGSDNGLNYGISVYKGDSSKLKNLLLNTPINKYLYRDIIRYFQSMVYTIAEYKDEAVIFEVSNEFQKHVLDTFRKYDKNNSDAFLLNLLKITGEKSYDMVMSDIKLNLKEINSHEKTTN